MPIDIRLLRKSIRNQLDIEELLGLLDRAIEMIPQDSLPELIEGFFDPDSLSVDELNERSLLDEVRKFHSDSLAGLYYESFDVNSKNAMNLSRSTINWMAEHQRLMARCLQESSRSEPEQIRQSFELLFNLLDEVDECRDDIIFFADEGGAWQVGVDWDNALTCYFTSLAAVAQPQEYADRVFKLIESHVDYNGDRYFELALATANPVQQKALKARLSNV
jgi:hypothetical protein